MVTLINYSVAYHSQTDNQTEKVNQRIENHLTPQLGQMDTSSWVVVQHLLSLYHTNNSI